LKKEQVAKWGAGIWKKSLAGTVLSRRYMKRWVVPLFFSILGMAGAVQAKTLSEEEFAERCVKVLKAAQPDAVIRAEGTMNLTIKPANSGELHLYLGNAYKNYINEPGRLEEIVYSYAEGLKTMMAAQNKKYAFDRTRVVATVKDRSWIDEMRRAVKERTGRDPEYVYEEFCDGLVVVYAEDTSDSVIYFTRKQLEETELQRSSLRELAVANMRRIVPNYRMEHIAGVWSITTGQSYESSLLLYDELWAGLSAKYGDIVVAIPSREILLFTPASDSEGVNRIREQATEIARTSAYWLTDKLFIYHHGRFDKAD
jgi:uncharacterized protein YtpQ (UPF0354 family)